MIYPLLRAIHMSAASISLAGFVARGLGSFLGAPWIRRRAVRIVPHVVDTVLLLSAIGMLWVANLSPSRAPWLEAKIAGLILYILLGSVALRRPRPGRAPRPLAIRVAAWLAALLVFGFIVSVAISKNPWGALRLLR